MLATSEAYLTAFPIWLAWGQLCIRFPLGRHATCHGRRFRGEWSQLFPLVIEKVLLEIQWSNALLFWRQKLLFIMRFSSGWLVCILRKVIWELPPWQRSDYGIIWSVRALFSPKSRTALFWSRSPYSVGLMNTINEDYKRVVLLRDEQQINSINKPTNTIGNQKSLLYPPESLIDSLVQFIYHHLT